METVVKYILKSYFDDYIETHGDIDLSANEGVCLKDLKFKNEYLRGTKEKSASGIQLSSGVIGSLQFKAVEQGHLKVVASEVVFDFHVDPMKVIGNAIRTAQDASVPGFVHRAQEKETAGQWQSLLGVGTCATETNRERHRPMYCGLHHRVERRARGPTRFVKCKACGDKLETNYVMCSLCTSCSRQQRRCLLCCDPDIMQTERDRIEDEITEQMAKVEAVKPVRPFGIRSIDDFVPRCSDGFGTLAERHDVLGMFRCGSGSKNGKVRQTPRQSAALVYGDAEVIYEEEMDDEAEHPSIGVYGIGREERSPPPQSSQAGFTWSQIPPLNAPPRVPLPPRTLTGDDLSDFLGEGPDKCLLKVDQIGNVPRMNVLVQGPPVKWGGTVHGGHRLSPPAALRDWETADDKIDAGPLVMDEMTCSACGQRVNKLPVAPLRRAAPPTLEQARSFREDLVNGVSVAI